MTRRLFRLAGWAGVAGLVVVSGRTLAYALAPRPTLESMRLGQLAGGPSVLELTVVALGTAALLAAIVLGLATAAVRQRHLLVGEGSLRPPAPRIAPVLVRASGLWLVTILAFAGVESWIHARAGLGFHGLHCLLGPAHRDAAPILAALSLFAAALVAAAGYLLVWLRRTLEVLRRPRLRARRPALPASPRPRSAVAAAFRPLALGSRAPPRPPLTA